MAHTLKLDCRMGRDGTGIQSLKTRIRLAINHSRQLIVQSKILHMRTKAVLDRLEEHIESRNVTGLRNGSDFRDPSCGSVFNCVMESAMRIAGTNMANLQILDSRSGMLYIAAQHGFDPPFLDYFRCVHEGEAACGQALKTRSRIVINDVTESPVFRSTPELEVLLDAGVRAVQCTPLIGRSGALRGILSTHWSSPRWPTSHELIQLEHLARNVADWLECRVPM